jgi:S-DNA-T family DNA segregation ATPase FtsK/SpoIIIE
MKNYELPTINLLTDPSEVAGNSDSMREKQKSLLVSQLSNFNIEGEITEVHPGPLVTQFEFQPAKGIKASQVANLSSELAMALKAEKVRVVAPIPGKSTVGIEAPTENPEIVWLKDIISSENFSKGDIPIALGKTIDGTPISFDLATAPHMLVAGQTGSGKSAWLNTMLLSILLTKTPDELELILIDPKKVELLPFKNVPHLTVPVITDPEDAVNTLKAVTIEMDARYDLLAERGVRNIQKFNTLGEHMPFMVVVIDELADLMMTTGKEIEDHIVRIAQKARAVGIHLVLTTQRPSVDIITGRIKANIPSRMGFRTASYTDSMTIMGSKGCEDLLGNGDMLFKAATDPVPERIHGCYAEYKDVDAIAQASADQAEPVFHLTEPKELVETEKDPLFDDAIALIKKFKTGSTSFVQRKLNISYARAVKLMKQAEEVGIIKKI